MQFSDHRETEARKIMLSVLLQRHSNATQEFADKDPDLGNPTVVFNKVYFQAAILFEKQYQQHILAFQRGFGRSTKINQGLVRTCSTSTGPLIGTLMDVIQ